MLRVERNEQINNTLTLAADVSPATVRDTMRELCRVDLFFLLTRVLGRKDADRDWLYDRCVEVQAGSDGFLDLWAREHYKSTIITFAKTIQDILINPEITVGIFSHTKPIARAFLRQIKYELETNERLKVLFPDIFYQSPKNESSNWSEDKGITVKRKSNPKEATVEAHGLVDGQPTSRHFSLLVYDDVVTRESVTSPDMINKTTDAWALSLNLGTEDGEIRYIGTRYHFNDTYKKIMDRGAATPRIYPATENGKVDGVPVLLTKISLAQKRRDQGSFIFSCQMLQNPREDESQGFAEKDLRYWKLAPLENTNKYIIVDPAGEKKKGSDYTSMFVIGCGMDNNYYVIDMIRDRINLTERTSLLFMWHRKYRPLAVGYEKYGMQSDIEHIEYVQEQENYRFEVQALGGATPKNDRIRKLLPIFEQGRMYFPQSLRYTDYEGRTSDLVQDFINDEFLPFPVMLHDDMLDCLARVRDPDFHMAFPVSKVTPLQPTQAENDWSVVFGKKEAAFVMEM